MLLCSQAYYLLEFVSLEVVGVKQMMRFFTQRFAKIFFIQLNDVWVFMGLSEFFTSIFVIENFGSLLEKIKITMVIWLTTTANAAAGASHDLDSMKFGLAGLHF